MLLFSNKIDKIQWEMTVLREFVRFGSERLNIDIDIQKYINGPRFELHTDRTVQQTKPTPAFISAVASSCKAIGQTSNVVNHATHAYASTYRVQSG